MVVVGLLVAAGSTITCIPLMAAQITVRKEQ